MKTLISALFALSVLAGVAGADARAKAGADHWQASRIVIDIDNGSSVVARRMSLEAKATGWTWRGEVEETGEPVLIMWWKQGRFSGMLTYRGDMFSLTSMTTNGAEVHAVAAPGAAPAAHAAEHAADEAGTSAAVAQAVATSSERGEVAMLTLAERRALAAKKVTIDVMVLYTRKAASRYLDVESDLVARSIAEANTSFVDSGIGNVQLRLVHTEAIGYDETDGEHFNHLYRMVDGVGPFAKVGALRNAKRADVVVLIVDDASSCGLATRVAADAEEAFAVVHHACAALTYSIPHEIGHIIGARHDGSMDQAASPFPYGHGFVNGAKWRDIMSYKASCNGCRRLALWSNPTIMIDGEPAGSALADNARVILEQAARVASFR